MLQYSENPYICKINLPDKRVLYMPDIKFVKCF